MMSRKQPSALATILGIIIAVVFIALMIVALPLLALLIGMTVGYILELFTQDYVVQAFNAIGLDGVQDGDLPKVFGLIALVAAMLKIGVGNAKKKTDD